MDSMQVLSRIYDLLSRSSDKDLREAAKLAGHDSELAEAIMMLRDVKRRASYRRAIEGGTRMARPKTGKMPSKYASNGLGKKLYEVVLSKRYFSTNRELADYLKKSKVPFRVDAKDSRKRIHSKLTNWIESMPMERQKEAYLRLLRILPPSETSGWFEAIRDSQP